jgi:hypothetical protein
MNPLNASQLTVCGLARKRYSRQTSIDRVRARSEALLKANAAPRCGARSKRTGKPCRGAAMPNGRCKFHGGKSTGPRTPEGLERSRRANWKRGRFSREAKAERSRLRADSRSARRDLKAPVVPRPDTKPHRTIYLTIYLTGIDANGKVARASALQAVQGSELTAR